VIDEISTCKDTGEVGASRTSLYLYIALTIECDLSGNKFRAWNMSDSDEETSECTS
jgi:hypothetical protein